MYIYIVYIFFEIIFIGYNVIISSLGCRFLNIFFQFVRKAHTHTHTHTHTHKHMMCMQVILIVL